MENSNEHWQVEVNGEIYDTTFSELTVWISESSLLVNDKVRRGNLRWLEAGKVPPLLPFFEAKANGTEPPAVQINVTDATGEPVAESSVVPQNIAVEGAADELGPAAADNNISEEIDGTICNVHPEREAAYMCSGCRHGFCKTCPQSFGSSVKICPYCGAMCKAVKDVDKNAALDGRIQADIAAGFGFSDFITALGYPLRYKFSFFFGGLFVAILSYGQTAASMGSFFLIGAAIICFIMSSAIVFGMVSNTLNNFAKGEIEENFMPGFDDFSAWDDVIHPFFLFIGVWVASFGVATILFVGMVWYMFNAIAGQAQNPEVQMATMAKESAQNVSHVAAVRKKLVEQNAGRAEIDVGEDGLTDAQRLTVNEEAEFQRVNDIANNYRTQQLESTVGKMPEKQNAEMQAMFMKVAQAAGIFIVFIGIALLWGFFYFPAACAVAGYTRSFAATINPLVGLDTIKHLGVDYVKILLMSLLISIISGIIGGILAVVFSPFDLPGLGNLPAKFVGSFVGFYFWIVYAVMLGLALYKNSDKLKLYR